MSPNDTWGRGASKICQKSLILFEWPLKKINKSRDHCSQFPQHFTSSFFAHIFLPKYYHWKHNCKNKKMPSKAAHKTLVKLPPVVSKKNHFERSWVQICSAVGRIVLMWEVWNGVRIKLRIKWLGFT